jgi:hypothetical protein
MGGSRVFKIKEMKNHPVAGTRVLNMAALGPGGSSKDIKFSFYSICPREFYADLGDVRFKCSLVKNVKNKSV